MRAGAASTKMLARLCPYSNDLVLEDATTCWQHGPEHCNKNEGLSLYHGLTAS